jgi:hypothetical protein
MNIQYIHATILSRPLKCPQEVWDIKGTAYNIRLITISSRFNILIYNIYMFRVSLDLQKLLQNIKKVSLDVINVLSMGMTTVLQDMIPVSVDMIMPFVT